MTTGRLSRALYRLHGAALRRDGAGLTDGQLLDGYLARRDEAAFEALLRRHGPMVLGVCRRVLQNIDDADDAFQATFLVLVRKAASVVPREAVGNWLYGVAYRTALAARSAAARRRAKERQVDDMPRREPSAEDPWEELRPLLDQELNGLPDKYRVPVVLCDLQGKTRREAALQLGWPEGTLAGRLARARVLLARRLSRRGVALTGGVLATLLARDAASAQVPESLLTSTAKAAAGNVPAAVAALTERVLRTMLLLKLKVATAMLLLGLLGLAASASLPGTAASPQDEAKKDAPQTGKQEVHWLQRPKVIPVADEKVRLALLSPDGKSVLTVSAAGTDLEPVSETNVRLWDCRTGDLKYTLLRNVQVDSVSFSASGKALLTDDWRNGQPCLWDLSDLKNGVKKGRAFPMCQNLVAVAFAPEEKTFVAVTQEGIVYAYDVAGGKLRWEQQGHDGLARCAAFSGDGKWVATGGNDKAVQIRDAKTGELKHTLNGHADKVNAVAFSPDHKLLASCGYDGTARLWDVQTGKPLRTLTPGNQSVRSLAFAPDGRTLATGGLQNVGVTRVALWDVESGKLRHDFTGKNGGAFSVGFSRDGTLLMAAGGREILLWRIPPRPRENPNKIPRPRAFSVADEKVRLAHLTPDGRTVLTVSEGRGDVEPAAETNVRLWDARTGGLKHTLLSGVQTDAVALSRSGKFLLTGDWGDGPSRLWDLSNPDLSPKEVRTFAGLRRVTAVAFAPDGQTCAAVTRDGGVVAYDVDREKSRWEERAHAGAARCVAYSRDGKLLATAGDDRTVQIRDARTGAVKYTLKGHASRVNAVAFSPDGRLLASGGEDGTARLWDVASGRPRHTLRPDGQAVPSVAFAPDGRTLATGGLRKVGVATVALWDVASGEPRQQFDAQNGAAFAVAFARDGEWLMAAGGCEILQWQVK